MKIQEYTWPDLIAILILHDGVAAFPWRKPYVIPLPEAKSL